MARKALTDRLIRSLKPSASGRFEIFDARLPGFCLRVTARGKKTFALMYRFAGRQERLTLGRYPTLSLARAREKVDAALRSVEAGVNPAEEKRSRRTEHILCGTVRGVADDYIERHAKRNTRSWRETKRLLDLYLLPGFGDLKIELLTRRMIRDLVDDVVDQGKPVQANRVLVAVHAMLAWAVEREIIELNPASGIKKPTRERERERVLSDDELRAVWSACETIGYPAGPLVQLLILTGVRRGEVRAMRWREVELEKRLWTIPGERAKNGQAHVVPLSKAAELLLRGLPTFEDGDHIFTCSGGAQPYTNLIKPKRRLDELSEVTGWTLHDLRRTVASGMGDLGIAGETIARVLNHSERAIAGVTARYNRADFTEAKRRALDAWATHVVGLEAANVVRLHAYSRGG